MSDPPLVVEIKRGSHEDGPGIRSVVFFKGCPLRCSFCHNPEAQDAGVEIAVSKDACIHCGKCGGACDGGALDLDSQERIDRARCVRCGACAAVCPGNGLRRIGDSYEVDELVAVLLRDLPFYHHSGGGITLSGGECTMYPDYLESLLKRLKKWSLHIVLETSGHFQYNRFERQILPYLDLIFYDVKIADPELHRVHTGVDNRLILDNLERLIHDRRVRVSPRVPLVPGITATEANLSGIVGVLRRIGADEVSLQPYNPLGLDMWERLGKEPPALPRSFMSQEEERSVRSLFAKLVGDRSRSR